jgi:hypothetical protein
MLTAPEPLVRGVVGDPWLDGRRTSDRVAAATPCPQHAPVSGPRPLTFAMIRDARRPSHSCVAELDSILFGQAG